MLCHIYRTGVGHETEFQYWHEHFQDIRTIFLIPDQDTKKSQKYVAQVKVLRFISENQEHGISKMKYLPRISSHPPGKFTGNGNLEHSDS